MPDRGGESSSPTIEIFDGAANSTNRASTPSSLPLPIGQLLALFGVLLIAVGAFTLASGADLTNSFGEPEPVGLLECNRQGTVCRYTSPSNVVSWLCVAPCEIPAGMGFGQPVFEFGGADGIPIDGLAVGSNGELLAGGGASGMPVSVGPDGRIRLDGGTDGVRIEFGLLPSSESADGNEPNIDLANEVPSDTERPSASDGSSTSPSGGADFGRLLSFIAPIAILVGIAALGLGMVSVLRALQDRDQENDGDEESEVPRRDLIEDVVEPHGAPSDPMVAVAAERVRIVSDLIEDLRAEPDPSRAIQRAYAALETGFGNPTLARYPSETCSTYLHRTIGVVGGVSQPLRTLTTLFELARFSTEPIDEVMRGQAIDALISVRSAWSTRASRGGSATGSDSEWPQ